MQAKRKKHFGRVLGEFLGVAFCIVLVYLTFAGAAFWYEGIKIPKVPVNKTGWVPFRTYSPAIENALSLLAEANPGQYEYIRHNGISIRQLTPEEFLKSGCRGKGIYGCTSRETGIISINEKEQVDAAFQAAVISHEVVHVQHSDPLDAHSRHSLGLHIFFQHEEAEAHLTGNWTLTRLARRRRLNVRGWLNMWLTVTGEFFVYFAPFSLVVLSGAWICFLFYAFRKMLPPILAKARRPPLSGGCG